MAVIGIDLGTTNSAAAVCRDGKTEMIPTKQGNFLLPSVVAYVDGKPVVGEYATRRSGQNVIYETKRIIGQTIDNEAVMNDVLRFSYSVSDLFEKHVPYIVVDMPDGTNDFKSPQMVAADILSEIRQYSEAYLGEPITGVVITVPAYFNDGQRKATKEAAEIARLNVLSLLNEPTAAAVAYGSDNDVEMRHTLVIDAGGGTFDVSLLSIDHGVYHVQAIAGDSHLGGTEFDNVLEMLVMIDFSENVDVRTALAMKRACERAKCELSTMESIWIEFTKSDGILYRKKVTRDEFETMSAKVLGRFRKPIEQVFRDACMDPNKVRDIVMVGGTTRIPSVQSLVKDFFHQNKTLYQRIHPDQVVAKGAAIHAAQLVDTSGAPGPVLLDVVPLSIGVETNQGIMVPIIKRNTTIPVTHSKMFSTLEDNQTNVNIRVFEGERSSTEFNHELGKFELINIRPEPMGEPQIEITFSIDIDGILTVTAVDIKTEKSQEVVFTSGQRLSGEEANKRISDWKKHRVTDEENLKTKRAVIKWNQSLHRMAALYNEKCDYLKNVLDPSVFQMISDVLDEQLRVLDTRQSKEDCDEMIEQLENIYTEISKVIQEK